MEKVSERQLIELYDMTNDKLYDHFKSVLEDTGLNEFLQEGHDLFGSIPPGHYKNGIICLFSYLIIDVSGVEVKYSYASSNYLLYKLISVVKPGSELRFAARCKEVIREIEKAYNAPYLVEGSRLYNALNEIEFYFSMREHFVEAFSDVSHKIDRASGFKLKIWDKNINVKFLGMVIGNRNNRYVIKNSSSFSPEMTIVFNKNIDSSELIKEINMEDIKKLALSIEMGSLFTNVSAPNQNKNSSLGESDSRETAKINYEANQYTLRYYPEQKMDDDSLENRNFSFLKTNSSYRCGDIVVEDFSKFIAEMKEAHNLRYNSIYCSENKIILETKVESSPYT